MGAESAEVAMKSRLGLAIGVVAGIVCGHALGQVVPLDLWAQRSAAEARIVLFAPYREASEFSGLGVPARAATQLSEISRNRDEWHLAVLRESRVEAIIRIQKPHESRAAVILLSPGATMSCACATRQMAGRGSGTRPETVHGL